MNESINWNNYFIYDESSPSCLRWKNNGKIAGSLSGKSWRVQVDGKDYYAHRIVYEMYSDVYLGDYQVDHIDRNPTNNRITNLRIVTNNINARNRNKQINNTSGITGVHFNNTKNSWVATWNTIEGVTMSKSYSIKKYGEELAKKLACTYRQKMLVLLNAQGAGYTELHGI